MTITPSDFIRSMPNAKPAEIMAAAKAKGLKFSRGLIYLVRQGAAKKGGSAGAKSASAKSAGAKKAAASATSGGRAGSAGRSKTTGMTASDFVRSMPGVPASVVVAEGKKAGLTFSKSLVYVVRGSGKKRGSGAAQGAPRGGTSRGGADMRGGTEAAFRQLVLEIGVDRAAQLIAEVRTKIDALIAGR